MGFNFFDILLLFFLIAGVLQGRKHGMSEELMNLIKWVVIVVVCAVVYEPGGQFLAQSSPFSLLSSFLMVYVTCALLIYGIFALLKHSIGGKLIGSDIFGRAEYYLGMGSGLLRFTCMLIVGLALLNARYFSPQEVRAMENYQNDMYGSNFFPGLHSAQSVVFEKSFTGPLIKDYLGFALIKSTKPENKDFHQKDANVPY